MQYKRFGNKIVARIDRGEEILESLKTICTREKILLGTFTGIGAVGTATIGAFKPDTKEYLTLNLSGVYEVTSLNGNISTMQGDVYIHPHITLSGIDHAALGGHLNRAVVSATCEITIEITEGRVERSFSKEVGLNLYDFEQE